MNLATGPSGNEEARPGGPTGIAGGTRVLLLTSI
jgi:hypothetical protein